MAPLARSWSGDAPVLVGLWVLVAGGLVVFAARQVHPGIVEQAGVGVVLLVAAVVSLVLATREQIVRGAPWIVPAVLVLVVLGIWNPWQLAAVTLLLRHPFAAGIGVAALVVVVLAPSTTRSVPWAVARSAGAAALIIAAAVVLVVGAVEAVFVSPGAHVPAAASTSDTEQRLDRHEGVEAGRCEILVLRVGSGLTMRERTVADSCHLAASLAARADELGVCVVTERRTATRSWFDPKTLAARGDPVTSEVAGGEACSAYGDAP